YVALVWGGMPRRQGSIDAPLGRSSANRARMAVVKTGRAAMTHYQVRATFAAQQNQPIASLLELVLKTGPTHQVRVHLAHIGHPLLGDMAYGAGFKASARNLPAAAQQALEALGRQALHARELAFVHPVTKERLRFKSPLPTDMAELLAALTQQH